MDKADLTSITRSFSRGVKSAIYKAVSGITRITHTVTDPPPCDLLKQLNLDYSSPPDDIEAYLTYKTNTRGVYTKPISLKIVNKKGKRQTNNETPANVDSINFKTKPSSHNVEAIDYTSNEACTPRAVLEVVSETKPACVVQNECSGNSGSDRHTKVKRIADGRRTANASRESCSLLVDGANTNFNNCQGDQKTIARISDPKHDTSFVDTGINQTNEPLLAFKCTTSVITNTLETVRRKLQTFIEKSKPEDETSKSIKVRSSRAVENAPTNNNFLGQKTYTGDSGQYIQRIESDSIKEFEHDMKFLSHCFNMTSTPEKGTTENIKSFQDNVYKTMNINQRPVDTRLHSPLATPPSLNKIVQAVCPEMKKHPDNKSSLQENSSCTKSTDSSFHDLVELDASHFKVPLLAELNENLTDRNGHPICVTPVRRCLSFNRPTRGLPESHIRYKQKNTDPAKTFKNETEEAVYYLIKKYLGDDEYQY